MNKLLSHRQEDVDANNLKTAITVDRVLIEFVVGDIVQQKVDAIVNAANSSLRGGAGVDGAIHQAAGPQLAQASSHFAPCAPGDVVLTPGFRLQASWVIHTVGPIYRGGTSGEADILTSCYRKCLNLAIRSRFSSIAFPSISTGVYGYPVTTAAEVALRTTIEILPRMEQLQLVRFVLYTDYDYNIYSQTLQRIVPQPASSEDSTTNTV